MVALVKHGFDYESIIHMPMAEIMIYLNLLAKPPTPPKAPGAQRYIAQSRPHGA